MNMTRSWILYDVGNSAFILLAASIIPIYFHHIAAADGISESEYLAYWSVAAAFVTTVMLFLGPVLGSYSDRKGWRKTIFIASVVIGALSCVACGLPEWWVAFLLIFVIARIAYNASIVTYDGMLNDVATDEEMDSVSSNGYAMGYIGSCIPFIICLVFVVMSSLFDEPISVAGLTIPIVFTFREAVIIGLIITAVWWVTMSLPLFRNYEQRCYNDKVTRSIRESLMYFLSTLRDIAQNRAMLFFILAFFFYIDGVYTIMDLSTAFGESLGLGSVGLLGALLLSQVILFPSTMIMSNLAKRYGAHRIIAVSIIGYLCISAYATVLHSIEGFYILAVGVGLFQGSIQALSRSYFGKMVPKEKTGEYFGLLDIFGKGATIIGTFLVAILTPLTGDIRMVATILLVMFGIGFLLFMMSVRERTFDAGSV